MKPAARKAWLEDRRRSLGGSDIGAVMELSKFRTPYEVWASKVHGYDGGSSEAADIGNDLEEPIYQMWLRDLAARDLGFQPVRDAAREEPGLLRPPMAPWAHATPDRVVFSPDDRPIVVQIKNSSARGWGAVGGVGDPPAVAVPDSDPDGNVPATYFVQVLWEMWIVQQAWGSRYDFGVLMVLNGTRKRGYRVMWDDETIDAIVQFGRDWWRSHVEDDVPPDVTGSDVATLAAVFDGARGRIDLDPGLGRVVQDLKRYRRDAARARDNADTCKAILVEALGAAQSGLLESDLGERWELRKSRGKNGGIRLSIRDAGQRRPSGPIDDIGIWHWEGE